jgi:hypothetical protein
VTIEEAITNLVNELTVVPEALLRDKPIAIAEMRNDYKIALVEFSKAIIDEMVKEVRKEIQNKKLVQLQ